MIAIGTLLMIVPNVQALECYYTLNPDASPISGGHATRENIVLNGQQENPLMLPIGDTFQCPAGYNYCATYHCRLSYRMIGLKNKLT
jgi:hypothetical protein